MCRFRKLTKTLSLVGITSGLLLLRGCAAGTPRARHLAAIGKYLSSGENSMVRKIVADWVGARDINEGEVDIACDWLAKAELHASVVLLIERCGWHSYIGHRCPGETLNFMLEEGMHEEVDKMLTYGTALAGENDRGKLVTDPWPKYRPEVFPQAAIRLFGFHAPEKAQLQGLFDRYESELAKRPGDVGLITEYAYWLSQHRRMGRAVELLEQLDLDRLDMVSLTRLGDLWRPGAGSDAALGRFTLAVLETALGREMTDREAMLYFWGGQKWYPAPAGRQIIRKRLLHELARRYVSLGRDADAKRLYEEFFELLRHRGGSHTGARREYAKILQRLGLELGTRGELARRAEKSGKGADWAELAAHLQVNGEILEAKNAWEKAIALTPLSLRKGRAWRRSYQSSLAVMLREGEMYEEEIQVLKEILKEERYAVARMTPLRALAKAHLQCGKKEEAIRFLLEELENGADARVAILVLRTDEKKSLFDTNRGEERSLFDKYPSPRREAEKLPSWNAVLSKIASLKEPHRSRTSRDFHRYFRMRPE